MGHKLIFLDVDGVLNHHSFFSTYHGDEHDPNGRYPVDPAHVQRINDLRAACGAEIVLSSSWRYDSIAIQRLKKLFPIMSITPNIPYSENKNKCRGDEIALWLEQKDLLVVDSFVIIDDDADMLKWQMPFFVHTSMQTGLTDEHCKKALQILTLPVHTSHSFLLNRKLKQSLTQPVFEEGKWK